MNKEFNYKHFNDLATMKRKADAFKIALLGRVISEYFKNDLKGDDVIELTFYFDDETMLLFDLIELDYDFYWWEKLNTNIIRICYCENGIKIME